MGISKVQTPTPNVTPSESGRVTSNVDLTQGPSFQEALRKHIPRTASESATKEPLRFSQHAVERMKSRGIQMGPEMMNRLQSAVSKAADKGSKNALLLSNDSAFVVSVKNNTVVTVMDRDMMKENVFTNIDSTVLL